MQPKKPLPNVKKILAIASGKGGVGKSTTAVHLALALTAAGFSVGLVDADVYGPSIPTMLGIPESSQPQLIDNNYFQPLMAAQIQTISIGNLTKANTPMIWRGPIASGTVTQLVKQTQWQNLDYLVIDLPPGTGDIHLTLTQQLMLDAAIVVTTPQNIAMLDAVKAIEMFQKVKVPVAGIIENMCQFICPTCHSQHTIFGEAGAQQICDEYHIPLLGSIPLDGRIRQAMDSGDTAYFKQHAPVYRAYQQCVHHLLAHWPKRAATPTVIME